MKLETLRKFPSVNALYLQVATQLLCTQGIETPRRSVSAEDLVGRDGDPSRFSFLGFRQFEFEYAVFHPCTDVLSVDGIG